MHRFGPSKPSTLLTVWPLFSWRCRQGLKRGPSARQAEALPLNHSSQHWPYLDAFDPEAEGGGGAERLPPLHVTGLQDGLLGMLLGGGGGGVHGHHLVVHVPARTGLLPRLLQLLFKVRPVERGAPCQASGGTGPMPSLGFPARWFQGSPDPHFAVHDGRGVEAREEVLHLDVGLPIVLHQAEVGRRAGLQGVGRQALQALLLVGTVFLQDAPKIPGLEVACGGGEAAVKSRQAPSPAQRGDSPQDPHWLGKVPEVWDKGGSIGRQPRG